jgi:alpha-mannosidase/mannosylglycerate hydrolase
MDNILEQYRLQVLFPTGIPADEYHVLTPFDVYRRSVFHPPDDQHNEPYPEYGICRGLVFLREKNNTAALLLRGLPEAGVLPRDDRALAVTLLRSTGRTVFTSGEEDGLLKGHREFEFALALFDGSPTNDDLVYKTLLYQNPPRFDQRDFSSTEEDAQVLRRNGNQSFIQNKSAFAITAVRELGDGAFEIRGFNPEIHPITVDLVVNLTFRTVRATDLLRESQLLPVKKKGKQIHFELPAKRIATLVFEE